MELIESTTMSMEIARTSRLRPPSIAALRLAVPRTGLRYLTPKHWRIINLYAAGFNREYISEELRITPQTVTNIVNDPLAKVILERHAQNAEDELSSLTGLAVEAVRDNLAVGDLDQRRRGAELVLKARGVFKEKAEGTDSAEDVMSRIVMHFQGPTQVNVSKD